MPVLKSYSDSYHKDGFYVHASVESLSHPLPLQTPSVTANLYKKLGYQAGDQVPGELTWKLYNAGLHWTENSGPTLGSAPAIESAIRGGDGPQFSNQEAEILFSLIDSYRGEFKQELQEFADTLQRDSSIKESGSGTSTPESTSLIRERLDNLSNVDSYHPSLEEYIAAKDGEVSDIELQILAGASTPKQIDRMTGETFGGNGIGTTDEYYRKLRECSRVAESLYGLTVGSPLPVDYVVPVSPAIGYYFDLESVEDDSELYSGLTHLVVTDYRFTESTEKEFQITITQTGVGISASIVNNHIADFTAYLDHHDLGNLDQEAIQDIELGGVEPEQVMHHGLGTLVQFSKIAEDFFEGIPEYTLCGITPFASKD
ncbi:hypothetical protein [Halorubellus sp. PRR65]|uniref:hypothetical protein n=1 Tax=Halorubellus sp. PRR65 TaxID=3098148 RepID=UPI002B263173|nr:hypothetical protein [Halorubellus sp. PRR65]